MKKAKEYKTEYGTVSLPMPLIDLIKKNIEGTGMQSVSAYVTFILRQVLSSPALQSKSSSLKDGEVLDKEAEDDVKKRLEHFGYI